MVLLRNNINKLRTEKSEQSDNRDSAADSLAPGVLAKS